MCQPNRTFREGLTHLAFYAESAIQPLVPRIHGQRPVVIFTEEEAKAFRGAGDEEVARLIEWSLGRGTHVEGESYGVFLLSPADSDETVKLDAPVVNDNTTATGKPWAWTLGQRYTSIDRLASGVRLTSQL